MTASATAPPAPHNRRSRVPNTHRVSLDCHTDGEYAQKQKKITKHFFGRLVTRLLEFEEEPRREPKQFVGHISIQACSLRCCLSRP